jgi:hypothetical protein
MCYLGLPGPPKFVELNRMGHGELELYRLIFNQNYWDKIHYRVKSFPPT